MSASLLQTSALDAPNSRAIARQLLELSQDPDNQPFIAQEKGCLAGLVGYVVHPDADVALMAARTLEFLSSHPQNKRLMRDFPGLLDALNEAYSKPENRDVPRLREFASKALRHLGVVLQNSKREDAAAWWGASDENDENAGGRAQGKPAGVANANATAPTPATASKYITITLHVDGLEDNGTATVAQRVLVNVKGVISVALQRERNQAVIGTRGTELTVEELCDALERAGLSGTSWPPPAPPAIASARGNDSSQLSAGSGSASATGTASAGSGSPGQSEGADQAASRGDDSGYLNEADYSTDTVQEGTVARWGVSTLEARLREEQEREAKTERLMTKVTGIVASAGSWLLGW